MAVTAVLSGTLTVGETGNPDVSKAINTSGITLTQQSVGQIKTTAGQTVTVPPGTIADIKMAYLKFHDGAGNARLATINVTQVGAPTTYATSECSEWFMNSGAATLTRTLSSMTVTTPATPTGDYICDYVLAGI